MVEVTLAAILLVLTPVKTWYAPSEPILVNVSAAEAASLRMTDFLGRPIDAEGSADVEAGVPRQIDAWAMFPPSRMPGTYLLYAVPRDADSIQKFIGTPLVISVRQDRRAGAVVGPMAIKVEPLRYASLQTEAGAMTVAFYYDAAPNTVASFQSLATGGFYDGLSFHRIVPGFVIQGGDPRGDGTGGPGFMIDAEFSDKSHETGVLSMARTSDPNEAPGVPPRPQFADSAGSQFFICLDHENTKQLDRRYTVFGRVVQGMDVVQALAKTPLADEATGRPVRPPLIRKVEILPVAMEQDPYAALRAMVAAPTTEPAPQPPAP
jgi:cyclophilin family peptidyl-prolyl cis-trans isomerase